MDIENEPVLRWPVTYRQIYLDFVAWTENHHPQTDPGVVSSIARATAIAYIKAANRRGLLPEPVNN